MKTRNRSLLTSLILGLLFATSQTSVADGQAGAFSIGDGRDVPAGSWRIAFSENSAGKVRPQRSHLPISDDSAVGAALPICSEIKASACIKSFQARVKSQAWQDGNVLPAIGQRYYHYGTCCEEPIIDKSTSQWKEDVSRKLPPGSTARVWELPIAHAGGLGYLVSVGLGGVGSGVDSRSTFQFNQFEASITPVTVALNANRETCRDGQLEENEQGGEGPCIRAFDFPENTEYKLEIYVGNYLSNLSGWLDARIIKGKFDYDRSKKLLTLQGEPATIPVTATSDISFEAVEQDKVLCNIAYCKDPIWKSMRQNEAFGIFSGVTSNELLSITQFKGVAKYLPEKAVGTNTVWRFSALPTSGDYSACAPRGEFSGIVSTNATVYTSGPPKWLKQTSEVLFSVGATHLLPNGEEFKGYYKLFMSERVAKCIWGITASGSKARIEVIENGTGVSSKTTSLAVEKGWLTFEAEGFTFSTPEIRVTLLGKKGSSRSPSSIICLKGKTERVVKNVGGVAANCPSGFKRK